MALKDTLHMGSTGFEMRGNLPHKEPSLLKEWEEAVSYLLGCTVVFQSYEEITNSLKPFSLGLE